MFGHVWKRWISLPNELTPPMRPITAAAILAALLVSILIVVLSGCDVSQQPVAVQPKQLSGQRRAVAEKLKPTGLADLIDKVEPSVIQIKAGRKLVGGGFIVDDSGLIVTNYHVVQGARQLTVVFENQLAAEVRGYLAVHETKDLILLRVETTARLTAIPLRQGLPRKGEQVIAFGAPKGFSGTVSQGIVSAVRKGEHVRAIVGQAGYRSLGYDPEMIWIQTTAAVSAGSSGGPLVDMDGKVVGINTWIRTDAQNLNFAVAATEIRRLLSEAGKECQELSTLLKPEKPKVLAEKPKVPREQRPGVGDRRLPQPVHVSPRFDPIELPSGAVLPEMAPELYKARGRLTSSRSSSVYKTKCFKYKIQGSFTFYGGKLHGPAVGLHPDGHLSLLGNYHMSRRDGPFRLWDENAEGRFYAEYTRGQKNGLICLFRDGLPWLIQEWDKGQTIEEYLVSFVNGELVVLPMEKLAAQDLNDFFTAQKRLSELEAELKDGEFEIKKELKAWFDRAKKQLARKGVMERSRATRGAAARRDNARRAAALAGEREKARRWRTGRVRP